MSKAQAQVQEALLHKKMQIQRSLMEIANKETSNENWKHPIGNLIKTVLEFSDISLLKTYLVKLVKWRLGLLGLGPQPLTCVVLGMHGPHSKINDPGLDMHG